MNNLLSLMVLITPCIFVFEVVVFILAWVVKYRSFPNANLFKKKRLKDMGGVSLQLTLLYIIGVGILNMAMSQQTSFDLAGYIPFSEGILSISKCYFSAGNGIENCGLSIAVLLLGAAWAYFQSSWDTLSCLWEELFDIN